MSDYILLKEEILETIVSSENPSNANRRKDKLSDGIRNGEIWTSATYNVANKDWIGFAFYKKTKVKKMHLYQEYGGSHVLSFMIEASNDKTTWDNINFSVTKTTDKNNMPYEEISISDDIDYLYWRVKATSNTGQSNWQWGVYELEMYIYSPKRLIFKNPTTNQHYSLAEKTLIPLPDSSSKNMILHGIEAGKEIQLDETFDKIQYINDLSTATQGTSGKIVTQKLLEIPNKILKISEVRL